jgi:glycosyltransferase involved in cell wall biosynthesis
MVLRLAERHPEWRCVIMGGVPSNRRPYFESLVAQANDLNLVNTVFLDNPSNQVVKEELARARFYIFPAINEHFGMTTAEAIASGAIPFVHDSGGQKEIVPDARLRFSDTDYYLRFAALLSQPESELNRIRAELLEHVQQYTEDHYIQQMLSCLFEGLLN